MSQRLLAMGVRDSIAHLTGIAPRPHQPRLRLAAMVGGYAIALLIVCAVLAYFGAHA